MNRTRPFDALGLAVAVEAEDAKLRSYENGAGRGRREARLLGLPPPCSLPRSGDLHPFGGLESGGYRIDGPRFPAARVRVRLYQEPPIWQMIILHRELWLWSAAGHTATNLSPVYVFERELPFGLSWALEEVWTRRWEIDSTRECPFDQLTAPDPTKIIRLLTPLR